MDKKKAVYHYKMAMAIVCRLAVKGDISQADKLKVERKLAMKYGLNDKSLYRENP